MRKQRYSLLLAPLIIPVNATWSHNGVSIGSGFSQPRGLFVEDELKILIVDHGNHRIMQYNTDGTEGNVVVGANGSGTGLHQLNQPMTVVIDQDYDSLIICDHGNRRVVRWSRRNTIQQGELLVDNITCYGIALDEQRNLYVSDNEKNEVRRYQLGDKNGIVVAGGNGVGSGLNQLHNPIYLSVDREQNIYISDNKNHRVMKWDRDATEGIVVAGGKDSGSSLQQLSFPNGVFVDSFGSVYVAEHNNHRVTRWPQGAQQGTQIVGENHQGTETTQFNAPFGLSFDRRGNLYVADTYNNRVQRFLIQ